MFSLDKFPVFFPCTASLREHWGIMNMVSSHKYMLYNYHGDLSCCADKTKNYDALHVVLSIKQNIGGPWEIIKSDKKLAYLAKIICVQFPKKIGASGFLNGLVNYLAWIFHNLLYNVMPSPIQVARNRNDLIVSTCIYTISNRKCMPPFQNLHIIQS